VVLHVRLYFVIHVSNPINLYPSFITVVHFTDQSGHTSSTELLLANCIANDIHNCDTTELDWRQDVISDDRFTNIDVILASDCFYDVKVFEPCLRTIAMLLNRGSRNCVCLFSYANRSASWTIDDLLVKYNLKCDLIQSSHSKCAHVTSSILQRELDKHTVLLGCIRAI
jgi:hypothetical protein